MTPEEKAAREYTDHFAFYQEWMQPSYIHHDEWVKDTAHYFEAFAYVSTHATKDEASIRAALLAYYRMLEPPPKPVEPPPQDPPTISPGDIAAIARVPVWFESAEKRLAHIEDLVLKVARAHGILA